MVARNARRAYTYSIVGGEPYNCSQRPDTSQGLYLPTQHRRWQIADLARTVCHGDVVYELLASPSTAVLLLMNRPSFPLAVWRAVENASAARTWNRYR